MFCQISRASLLQTTYLGAGFLLLPSVPANVPPKMLSLSPQRPPPILFFVRVWRLPRLADSRASYCCRGPAPSSEKREYGRNADESCELPKGHRRMLFSRWVRYCPEWIISKYALTNILFMQLISLIWPRSSSSALTGTTRLFFA